MGSSVSIGQDARSVGHALTSDDNLVAFFREEIENVVQQGGGHAPSQSLSKSISVQAGTDTTDLWEQTFGPVSPNLITSSTPLEFSLMDFCLFIADQPSLRTAGVISCACYTEPTVIRPIPHEFLTLRLRRDGRPDVWLRLDRFRSPDVGLIKLAQTRGTTPSNDRAMLASALGDLLRTSRKPRKKSELTFETVAPLSLVRLRLLEIVTFLDKYKLTSDNCWVFCYLLLSELAKANSARFLSGKLCHVNLAQRTERRLLARRFEPTARALSPDDISQFVPMSLLVDNIQSRVPYGQSLLREVRRWEDLNGFGSSDGQLLAQELIPLFHHHQLDQTMSENPTAQLALQTTALCRQIAISAGASWSTLSSNVRNGCLSIFFWVGKGYLDSEPPNPSATLPLFREAALLLVADDTPNWFVCNLYWYHALVLHDLGEVDEARVVVKAFIESVRHYHGCEGYMWRDMISELSSRGIWPSEFDHLLDFENGDLPEWENWRENQSESQPSLPSPSFQSLSPSNSLPSTPSIASASLPQISLVVKSSCCSIPTSLQSNSLGTSARVLDPESDVEEI